MHGRRRRSVNMWLIAFVLLLLMAGPLSTAETRELAVEGTLTFARADLAGATSSNAAIDAAYVIARQGESMHGSWNVSADVAVINWTRHVRFGIGSQPGEPDSPLLTARTAEGNESGETRFEATALGSRFDSRWTGFLVVARNESTLAMSVQNASEVSVGPADEDIWAIGFPGSDSVRTGSDEELLVASHRLQDGEPVFRSAHPLSWRVEGDFVLHVWEANVTVAGADGQEQTYRSGSWSQNATGTTPVTPEGAVREEHAQLLRLTLTNATMTWRHEAGAAHWTGTEATAETTGVVTYHGASGTLASPTHLYEASDESILIAGRVTHHIAVDSESRESLVAGVTAEDARINLLPSAPRPVGATAPDTGLTSAWPWLLAFALWGAAGLGVVVAAVRRRRLGVAGHMARAHDAIIQGRSRAAQRAVGRVIRKEPAHEEAWFVRVADLLERQKQKRVVEYAEKAPGAVCRFPPFASIVGLAFYQLGRRAEAVAWMEVACRDAEFRRHLQEGTEFEHVRDDERFQHLFKKRTQEASPGYA